MKRFILLLCLLASGAFAANFAVFFDPSSEPVANRVTGFRETVNDLEYEGRQDVLLIESLPVKDLTSYKVEGGKVIQLTQRDLDTIALTNWINASNETFQAEVNYRTFAKQRLVNLRDGAALAHRASLLVVMEEVNILRAQHGLAPRTALQLRNAIQAKIDDLSADTIE